MAVTATEIVMAAREEGLSYGQYVWKHGLGGVKPKPKAREAKCCEWCGMPMTFYSDYHHRAQKYCSAKCQYMAAAAREYERMAADEE